MEKRTETGPLALSFCAIMAGAACFGTLPLFARTLSEFGLAPAAIAFFRFALTAALLAPFVIRHRRLWRPILWGFAGGAGMGLGWIGFVVALDRLSVAQTGILFMTFPLFAIALAALFFGERPRVSGLIGAGLILLAAVIVAPPGNPVAGGLVTILMALTAPVAYAFILNIASRKLNVLPPLAAVGSVALGSVVVLSPVIAALPQAAVLPDDPAVLPWLFAFSALTALVPQLLFVVFAPRLGATRTAMAGSVELPMMFLVGAVAFGEPLGVGEFAAGALVIAAILIVARK